MESAARLLRFDDPKLYRPRRPERSPFYAVLHQFFDRFTREYEQRFERTFGPLRGIVPKTVERFFGCGLPEGGFARVRCDVCGNEYLVAFSCKQRGFCPSCCAKRAALWVEFVREQVIRPVPHRHFVFALPNTGGNALPAAIVSIQTAGEFLNWHPHLHVLAPAGAFRADGNFVHSPLFDPAVLRDLFQAKVLALLLKERIISSELVERMREWRHSGFHAYAGEEIPDIEDALRVGLYMVRGPAATSRLRTDPAQEPKLRYLAKGAVPDHGEPSSSTITVPTRTPTAESHFGARPSSRSRRRTTRPILRDPTAPGLRAAGNRGRASSAASTWSIRSSAVVASGCVSSGSSPIHPSSEKSSTTSGGASTP